MKPSVTPTLLRIQQEVARQFNVTVAELTGPRRPSTLAWARQMAMYLCRELKRTPYQSIGKAFGNRDHGTVIYACRKVGKIAAKDTAIQAQLQKIQVALQAK